MKQNEPLRCVIIEDVVGDVEHLTKKLADFPKEVKYCGTAASIQEAFKLIIAQKPHFVFLDIWLIDGSGFTVLDKLAAVSEPIPYIIATSAFKDFPHERLNSYVNYFLRYIEKPYADSELEEKLKEAIYAVWAKTSGNLALNAPFKEDKKSIFLNMGYGNIKRLDPTQIICVKVESKVTTVKTRVDKFDIRVSLNSFLLSTKLSYIVRVSANEAINIHRIEEVIQKDKCRVKMERFAEPIVVTETYRKDFLEMLEVVES